MLLFHWGYWRTREDWCVFPNNWFVPCWRKLILYRYVFAPIVDWSGERIWLKSWCALNFRVWGDCPRFWVFSRRMVQFLEGTGAWWWDHKSKTYYLCRFITWAHRILAFGLCCKVIGLWGSGLMLSEIDGTSVTYLPYQRDDACWDRLAVIVWTVFQGKWKNLESSAKALPIGQEQSSQIMTKQNFNFAGKCLRSSNDGEEIYSHVSNSFGFAECRQIQLIEKIYERSSSPNIPTIEKLGGRLGEMYEWRRFFYLKRSIDPRIQSAWCQKRELSPLTFYLFTKPFVRYERRRRISRSNVECLHSRFNFIVLVPFVETRRFGLWWRLGEMYDGGDFFSLNKRQWIPRIQTPDATWVSLHLTFYFIFTTVRGDTNEAGE